MLQRIPLVHHALRHQLLLSLTATFVSELHGCSLILFKHLALNYLIQIFIAVILLCTTTT